MPHRTTTRDIISITDLSLRCPLLVNDLWGKPDKSQPLLVSLSIATDVQTEAIGDKLLEGESLNYGVVTKTIEKAVKTLSLPSIDRSSITLEELAEVLARDIIFLANAPNVSLQLSRPRALLSARSIAVHITRSSADYSTSVINPKAGDYQLSANSFNSRNDKFVINELRRSIIIGVNDCERLDEQEVIVDIEFGTADNMKYLGGLRSEWQGWRSIVKSVEAHLSASHPLTIETLTTAIAQIILAPPATAIVPPAAGQWNISSTTVRIAKPCALMYAKYPAVQITRHRSDFFGQRALSTTAQSSLKTSDSLPVPVIDSKRVHMVVLGIGSNMGERLGNITRALRELEAASNATKVVDTSFLYESEAMYIVDQAKFLNAVVQIETLLSPWALLSALKDIEDSLGREKTIRNGPRVIDLDILFYDNVVFDSRLAGPAVDDRWLKIPHASIAEREFVLRPLADLASPPTHPILHSSPAQLLSNLLVTSPSTLHRVLPLSSSLTHCLSTRTLVMSILNATPDSFSDGGDNATLDTALVSALSHVAAGVDIVDIGGMSTRPGASDVDVAVEIERVVPLIKALRAKTNVPISIDTFRPEVARAAIEAGATIINDVLGGSTAGMLEMMAQLDVPVVLMHSRGTPANMSSLTNYPEGVVQGVVQEMQVRVDAARAKGVKRWNIIVDPGIGFAKTGQDNLDLLKHLPSVLGQDTTRYPSLVGLSRKKFLGTLTGKDNPKDRVMSTATGVTASIAGGADIVRVHDVPEMMDVVKVADGIYRGPL